MEHILEDLYYGGLKANRRSYRAGSYAAECVKRLKDLESLLSKELSGDTKRDFLTIVNTYSELLGDTALDAFLTGFRMGARMTYDTFCSDDAPFEDDE